MVWLCITLLQLECLALGFVQIILHYCKTFKVSERQTASIPMILRSRNCCLVILLLPTKSEAVVIRLRGGVDALQHPGLAIPKR
jgi:hypothetical protein